MTGPAKHTGSAASVLEVIGRTPTLRLGRIATGGAAVFAKLEHFSPNGRAADRLAAALLDSARTDGRLRPGAPVFDAGPSVEVGLAMLCRIRGHPFTAVLPEGTSLDRVQLLRAWGTQVESTPFEQGFGGARLRARQLAEAAPGGVFVDAVHQPLCVEVHAATTAVELVATVREDGGRLDAFGVGIGSGATFTAIARALEGPFPSAILFAVEPARAPVVSGGPVHPHRIEGLGTSGALLDRSLVRRTLSITDAQAWQMRERLGREEGLLLGLSGAASVWGALEVARGLPAEARVYTVCADAGEQAFALAEQF